MAKPENILHKIEDSLREDWLDDYAEAGATEIEAFLRKVIADRAIMRARRTEFNAYLTSRGEEPDPIDEVQFGAIPKPRERSALEKRARADVASAYNWMEHSSPDLGVYRQDI